MSWVRGGPLTGFGEYAEPASPLGEGEERRPRQRGGSLTRCSGVVGCAEDGRVGDAAHTTDWRRAGRVVAPGGRTTRGPLTGFSEYPEPASPLGEGEERRPRQRGGSLTRCSGVVGCAEDGRVGDPPLRKKRCGRGSFPRGLDAGACGSTRSSGDSRPAHHERMGWCAGGLDVGEWGSS